MRHDRRGGVATLGAVLATLALASAAAPLGPPAGRSESPSSGPVMRINVAMPEPLSAGDAETWIEFLKPSDEVAERVRLAVADFVQKEASDRHRLVARTLELAESVSALGGLYASPDALEAYRQMLRERQRAANRLGSLEEGLFAELTSELGESTGPAFVDAIRQIRRRSRFGPYRCDLPMADLDLRRIVWAIEADAPLEVAEPDAWRAAWPSHDLELASLHEQRVARKLRSILDDAESYQRLAGDLQALVDARTKGLDRKLQVERAIIEANRRWASSLAEMLEPRSAARLRDAVDAALYPELYPRAIDLMPLLSDVGPSLEAESRGLRELREVAEAEIGRLGEREERLRAEITDLALMESRSIVAPAARERLRLDIEALKAERCSAGKRVMDAAGAIPEAERPAAVVALKAACTQCK